MSELMQLGLASKESIAVLCVIALVLLVCLIRILLWRRKRNLRHDFNMEVEARLSDDADANTETVRGMDLTEGGIRLLWPVYAPAPGSCLTIFLQETERSASVIWSKGKTTGVAFDHPLSPAQVSDLTLAAMQYRLANG